MANIKFARNLSIVRVYRTGGYPTPPIPRMQLPNPAHTTNAITPTPTLSRMPPQMELIIFCGGLGLFFY
ncbi:MAG TPA: hypothetical protein VK856_11910 [Anaerolineaceae bacterium]|nr:hypothetical protein [Anaerolineaceae bacterium]